ncbi:ABC transporter permease [Corynebacterium choanae]|uniref:2-aminoethylphosphonate transport system permease protein PhnV n=1 Tax=Corynebacterium choanae TaxID=1862358 RepID=A0A3G6J9A1_9CORY|nr:iron ABC transporter permease [Corynebacterium choanae]AZA14705.1 Putative 2-aminoethylphosphonate transport system permease protein PhnV [Corynebacterium choanae]
MAITRAQKQRRSIGAMLRSPLNLVVLAILSWFILAFLIVPTFTLLQQTFFPDGQFTTRVVGRIAASDKAVASLKHSFMLAIILSVTVNLTGIFIVLVTRYFDIKGAKILWAGYATSLIYGGVTLVAGYKTIYGSNGYITKLLSNIYPGLDPNWFSGMFAVVFVMTFATTGNHMLFLSSSIAKLDYQTVEASRLMGASAWTTLIRVVLPTLKPMIFAITTLTFLGGLNALMAPLILGGENFQTVAPMILTFAGSPQSRDLAAGLAVVLGIATLLLVMLLNRLERKGQYFSVSKVPSAIQKQKITNPVANVLVHIAAYALFVIYMIPPVMIVIFSFTRAQAIQTASIHLSDFTLENYAYALTNPAGYKPLLVSLVYSTLASVTVVVMITLAARIVHKYHNVITVVLEYLLHIPWVLPSILIALGMVLAYSKPSPLVGGIILTGTSLLLLFGYIAERIPFTFRLMKASFSGISSSLEEAASMLGASNSYTTRKVLLPLVLPTGLAVGALSFNSLLTEFDMSVFVSHPLLQPLGPFIKQATQGEVQRDTTALVFVYTVLLMIVASITIWAVYGDHTKLKSRIAALRGGGRKL